MSPRPDFRPLRATDSSVARELRSRSGRFMHDRLRRRLVTAVHHRYRWRACAGQPNNVDVRLHASFYPPTLTPHSSSRCGCDETRRSHDEVLHVGFDVLASCARLRDVSFERRL
jgi:hypothetical protein